MKEALAGLLGSKKALAAMAGTVTSALILLAAKRGYGLDPAAAETLVKVILGIVAAYVLGQGVSDWGKESAKVQAAAMDAAMKAQRLELDELDAQAAEEAAEAPKPRVLTEEV